MSNRWTPRLHPQPTARLRLFLFPYAGGSASLYRSWTGAFPPAVDVVPVQLPGREERLGEPAFSRLEELADAAAEALLPLADRPVVLFGWSMGALIAAAVARRWEIAGRPVALLIPAAHPAPHLPRLSPPLHALPSEAFWQAVARIGGVPDEALANLELRDIMEPTLRADFAVIETRPPTQPRALSCPIATITADRDRAVTNDGVLAWAEATKGTTSVTTVRGDHFVIRSDAVAVITAVRDLVSARLEPPSPLYSASRTLT
ncbi:alpha/beta fold hydrolase [Telmatospirillum sp.]|uniref:thioesterase II family protein n=1 Tax=Telmatospirillum sp. TaxID=2079197 RepID=UPI00284D409A|nr:alpha/beta fold hydrolase [Telmatospirillum sp.]MDR3439529.1 alpha/beta fold hydrolase [Telmatospirillum sp.]